VRHLKVMPDYQCWPLWDVDEPDNVDPASLGITPALQARLRAWAELFEEGFDWDDPGNSPPRPPAWQEAFDAEGRRLVADLQVELGDGVAVRYWQD
jgi:hypothetical protein